MNGTTPMRLYGATGPGRARPVRLNDHRCTLEYTTTTGQDLRREVELVEARQAMQSVLITARTIDQTRGGMAEYRVHRMTAITGSDGQRMAPQAYLREKLGLVVE